MGSNELTVECELNTDDITAWNYYHIKTNPPWKRNLTLARYVFMPFMALFFIIGIIFLILRNNLEISELSFSCILLIVLSTCGFIYFLFYPHIVQRTIKKNVKKMYVQGKSNDLGTHKYSISSNGIHESSKFSNGILNWDAVENVVKTEIILARQTITSEYIRPAFPTI